MANGAAHYAAGEAALAAAKAALPLTAPVAQAQAMIAVAEFDAARLCALIDMATPVKSDGTRYRNRASWEQATA